MFGRSLISFEVNVWATSARSVCKQWSRGGHIDLRRDVADLEADVVARGLVDVNIDFIRLHFRETRGLNLYRVTVGNQLTLVVIPRLGQSVP